MIYFTSDLHLGHMAIIHMKNRPFEDVEEMNRKLISNGPGHIMEVFSYMVICMAVRMII